MQLSKNRLFKLKIVANKALLEASKFASLLNANDGDASFHQTMVDEAETAEELKYAIEQWVEYFIQNNLEADEG